MNPRLNMVFWDMIPAKQRIDKNTIVLEKDTHLFCPRCFHEVFSITGLYTRGKEYICKGCKVTLILFLHTDLGNGHKHYAKFVTEN